MAREIMLGHCPDCLNEALIDADEPAYCLCCVRPDWEATRMVVGPIPEWAWTEGRDSVSADVYVLSD